MEATFKINDDALIDALTIAMGHQTVPAQPPADPAERKAWDAQRARNDACAAKAEEHRNALTQDERTVDGVTSRVVSRQIDWGIPSPVFTGNMRNLFWLERLESGRAIFYQYVAPVGRVTSQLLEEGS